MKYLLFLLFTVALSVTSYSSGASLPETPDNTIVLDVASKGDRKQRGPVDPEDPEKDKDPFEIIVPVARNFSSLEELFRILREDDSNSKEPRVATGKPLSYVKGTERNASDYLIFFSDGVGKDTT